MRSVASAADYFPIDVDAETLSDSVQKAGLAIPILLLIVWAPRIRKACAHCRLALAQDCSCSWNVPLNMGGRNRRTAIRSFFDNGAPGELPVAGADWIKIGHH